MTGRPRVRRVTARLTIDLPKGTPYPAGTSADYIYDLSVSSAGVDPRRCGAQRSDRGRAAFVPAGELIHGLTVSGVTS